MGKKWQLLLTALMALQSASAQELGRTPGLGRTTTGYESPGLVLLGTAPISRCTMPGACLGGCPVFTFNGHGDWRIPGNWVGMIQPPEVLPSCFKIMIVPVSGETGFLVQPQLIESGGIMEISSGKKLIVAGSVIIGPQH
jgi:hypothetical protein